MVTSCDLHERFCTQRHRSKTLQVCNCYLSLLSFTFKYNKLITISFKIFSVLLLQSKDLTCSSLSVQNGTVLSVIQNIPFRSVGVKRLRILIWERWIIVRDAFKISPAGLTDMKVKWYVELVKMYAYMYMLFTGILLFPRCIFFME